MIFKIPVGNLSKSDSSGLEIQLSAANAGRRERAEKYIKQLISNYAYPLGISRIIKIKKILDKC
jgi:hypothetical protein